MQYDLARHKVCYNDGVITIKNDNEKCSLYVDEVIGLRIILKDICDKISVHHSAKGQFPHTIPEYFCDCDDLKTDEIFLKLQKTLVADATKDMVPSYHFSICLTGGTEVGFCDFRIGNTQKLFFGGNIGYTIYEKYRGNGYAAKAVTLLLTLAKKHSMSYLYITCNPDNIPSIRTCEKAGGKLIGIIELPTDNDMFAQGDKQACIYKFDLIT